MRLLAIGLAALAALAQTATAQVVPGAPTDPVQADSWALKQLYDYVGTPSTLSHWSNASDANPCSGKKWEGVTCKGGRVTEVDLRDKGLAGTLAPGLAAAGALKKLNLSGNALAGELPSAWGSAGGFESLTAVSLAGNRLEGDLPALWAARGALPSLYLLDLAGNNLTGTLPEAWGAPGVFPRLSVLGLRNNSLAGGLPGQWALNGSLPALEVLVLDGNKLGGDLPPEWGGGGLARLKLLTASNNALSGPLPAEWGAPGALPALQVLNLAGNELAGELPAAWVSRGAFRSARGERSGIVLSPGNAGLAGTIPPGSPVKIVKALGGGRVAACGSLPGCEAPPAALARGGEVRGGSGPQTVTATLVVRGAAAGAGAWSDGAKAALADAVTKAAGKDAAKPATVGAVSDLAASVAYPDVEVAPAGAAADAAGRRRLLAAAASDPLAGSQARVSVDVPDAAAAKRVVKALRAAARDGTLLKALKGAGLPAASLGLDGPTAVDVTVDGAAPASAGGRKRLNGGAIFGIILAVLAGLALLGLLGWWLWRRGVFERCGAGAGGGAAASSRPASASAAKAEAGVSSPRTPAADKMDVPYTEYRRQRLEGAAAKK